ncbi:MAG: RES family NAD+ phosphorylase, partial [Gammaproteobacteria bacterium]
ARRHREWRVSVILWRIAAATRDRPAEDRSGGGAARYPGRWNRATEAVLYCAPTRALAILESAAHIDEAGLPLNRFLVEIQVPDTVWSQREEVPAGALPATWDAIPAGEASMAFGSDWLRSRRSPVLLVPSVIVPEESCALLNPQHPLAGRISARVSREFPYGRLFRGRG